MKILPISVVIASVGGDQLFQTIKSLIDSEFVPAEVVVSLPPGVTLKLFDSELVNIKVVNSDYKGQVKQRIFAYKFCSFEIVMQSDDDVFYDCLSLKMMHDMLIDMGRGVVIGPALYDFMTKNRVTKLQTGLRGFIKNLFDSFVCLAPWGVIKMGKISKIGLGFGVDVNLIPQDEPFEVFWLPGACSMSFKSDVICEDYYPFVGKAFGEDILQSLKRNQRGLKMYILPRCRVYFTEMADHKMDKRALVSNIIAHRFILNKINGSILFFYIWAFIFFVKTIRI